LIQLDIVSIGESASASANHWRTPQAAVAEASH
jgi:hypothetical protein